MVADRARMRPFSGLAPWSTALEVIDALITPIQRKSLVPLAASCGRVLAADVISKVDVPTADRAAMDGYAVRSADTGLAGARLTRIGRISAGQPSTLEVRPGSCVEVATGALIPRGADAVVPVEDTDRADDRIEFRTAVSAGQHIATRGEDLQRGSTIGHADERVQPALLAACAAGGAADQVEVWELPRILVAPTGDEVVSPGSDLAPGQVYDSNAAGLLALLPQAGAAAEHAGIVIDRVESLLELLKRPGFDLIVTIGGTSVGRRDLVSDALQREGDVRLHGVAVRPGKPLLLGAVKGVPVVGLPGFPTTCMMLAYALLDPAVRKLARRSDGRRHLSAILGEDVQSPAGKTQLLPVALEGQTARPTFRFSSAVSSMASADGWIEIGSSQALLPAGTTVDVRLF